VRVVLDTNVIISGALTASGVCGRILDALEEGLFEICADDRVLDEYDEVLRRPQLEIDAEDAASMSAWLRSVAAIVSAIPLPVELPDPDDLVFLEVAAAADAVLVTGNLRHFPVPLRTGAIVVSPAEFLEILRRSP
jgi:uncharacterized protein